MGYHDVDWDGNTDAVQGARWLLGRWSSRVSHLVALIIREAI